MPSLKRLVLDALAEDVGQEDITTNRTVPSEARCQAQLFAKQDGVLSGMEVFRMAFDCLRARIKNWGAHSDGHHFQKGEQLASFRGNTRAVLTAERTAINFIQHLSGVATLTAQYVEAVRGLDAKICDTRKTTPLLRRLEKAAVVHGGGANHRHSLFNGIVIKENHIVAAGGLKEAVRLAVEGTHHLMKVEVEVRDLDEFDDALATETDAILLDNMSLKDMATAVKRARRRGKKVVIEASGNMTLARVRSVAETGVDVISVGSLTHSAPVADMTLLITNA